MAVTLHYAEKGGTKDLAHDLHFQQPKYEITHILVCPDYEMLVDSQEFNKPAPGLLKLLAESGETPGYTPPTPAPPAPPAPAPSAPEETRKRKLENTDDHQRKKSSGAAKGKEWTGKPNEMDRLAQGLQKLQEDDLLQIVRIVTEHKTPEMYVKNDLEGNIAPSPSCFTKSCLMCRGRVQSGFVYFGGPSFADSMGLYETTGGSIGRMLGRILGMNPFTVHIRCMTCCIYTIKWSL
jgi:transcription initiation factor IIF auxiliary subunit